MAKCIIAMILMCVSYSVLAQNNQPAQVASMPAASKTELEKVNKERDLIYSLMAYSVVYSDWQTKAKGDGSRGYNIGCVLVNKDGYVVYYGINSVNKEKKNKTQHGEVRAMQGYEELSKETSVKGYTIYTSLEPCCMCSGMMTLNQVRRTVYGESDPEYGKALERLSFNSKACCGDKGYEPYPRAVISDQSPDAVSHSLDSAFLAFWKNGNSSITAFLSTEEARSLYKKANRQFLDFKVNHPVNQVYLDSAQSYFRIISASMKKPAEKKITN